MKKLLTVILTTLVIVSCNKDDDNFSNSMVVTVLHDGVPASNVAVITDPATSEMKTDAFGQAEFRNIPPANYNVYAFIPKTASGKTTVQLGNGAQEHIDVDLINGVFIEPSVTITSPEDDQGFAQGEEIEFKGLVDDNNTTSAQLAVKWKSNLDGELAGGTIDANGNATLKIATLSQAEHYVSVSVTNLLGITSKDSVLINTLSPPSLAITLSQAGNFDNTINWTSTTAVDKFEIYRYTKDATTPVLLSTLGGASATYFDNLVPFTDSVFYFVKSYNAAGYSSISNVAGAKGSPLFDIAAVQAERHAGNGLIYLRSGSTITALNPETYSVAATKTFSGNLGYFHVGDNGSGDELYVPNSDGWLYIHDLATLTEKAKINVGVSVECVISNGAGLLFTSVTPSPWWEDPLRVYRRSDLSFVDGGGDFDDTRLRLLQDGNSIIEISTSISPIDMDYYSLDANGMIVTHADDAYHGDYPLDADIFKVAPANNYLITSSQGAIYNANSSMTYVGSLPRGGEQFSDFEFNSDGTVIYAALTTKKAVFVHEYPSLSKTAEIATKGYPLFIFRDGNRLIVISSPDQVPVYNAPAKLGIELHELN